MRYEIYAETKSEWKTVVEARNVEDALLQANNIPPSAWEDCDKIVDSMDIKSIVRLED